MEEQLMTYDDAGNALGLQSRTTTHEKGLWHRVIHIWMYDEKALYLQQRSFTKKAFPGGYDITCAGHVDPQEKDHDAAIRECQEELGITLHPHDLIYKGEIREVMKLTQGYDREIASIFLCRVKNPVFAIGEEVIDIGTIPLLQFKQLLLGERTHCAFTSCITEVRKDIPKAELLLHEAKYYQQILQFIED